MHRLGLNSSISKASGVQIEKFGSESLPVFIVDDAVEDPQSLVKMAGSLDGFSTTESDYYPGVKKALDLSAYRSMLSECLASLSGTLHTSLSLESCQFSVVTTQPNQLKAIQRVPHYDSNNLLKMAMVHYLCDEDFGGTGFFSHRSSGYEFIDQHRETLYQRSLAREITTVGLPDKEYPNDGGRLFELVHCVSTKNNRAIFYPASCLHSGLIKNMAWRAQSIESARLTITGYLSILTD